EIGFRVPLVPCGLETLDEREGRLDSGDGRGLRQREQVGERCRSQRRRHGGGKQGCSADHASMASGGAMRNFLGRRTENTLPSPGALRTTTEPWWSLTISRAR